MFDNSGGLQTLTEDFRQSALEFGISGQTVERMARSPERALACLQDTVRRGGGPGLAVHMFDEGDHPQPPKKSKGANLAVTSECKTCAGDRFVVVRLRAIRGRDLSIEEYAPCPDCQTADVSFWRSDGTRFVPPDPETVRQMMNG